MKDLPLQTIFTGGLDVYDKEIVPTFKIVDFITGVQMVESFLYYYNDSILRPKIILFVWIYKYIYN